MKYKGKLPTKSESGMQIMCSAGMAVLVPPLLLGIIKCIGMDVMTYFFYLQMER